MTGPFFINVTDQRKHGSVRTFTINVSSPADLIEINLAQLRAALTDIKSEISSLDSFSRAAINTSLGLSAIEASINSLQTRYNTATSTQLNGIVTDLLRLSIPDSISKTRSAAGLPLIFEADNVDLDVLESIAGGSVTGNEDAYVEVAAFWQIENLETKVDFGEFSGRFGNALEPITRTFKITTKEKRNIPYDYYLIMPMLDGFYSDSRLSNKSGYI